MGGFLNFGSLLNLPPTSGGGVGQGQESFGALRNRPLGGSMSGVMPLTINPMGMLGAPSLPTAPGGGIGGSTFRSAPPAPGGMAPAGGMPQPQAPMRPPGLGVEGNPVAPQPKTKPKKAKMKQPQGPRPNPWTGPERENRKRRM